jgi:hypothetical protein
LDGDVPPARNYFMQVLASDEELHKKMTKEERRRCKLRDKRR